MRRFLAAIVLVFALGACAGVLHAPLTPQQQLAAVELTFTEVVEQLVVARNTGAISDDNAWRCAQATAKAVDVILDNAHRFVVNGQSIAIILGNVQAKVQALRRVHATGENICVDNSSDASSIRRAPIRTSTRRVVHGDHADNAGGRAYGTHARGMGAYHVAA